MWFIGTALWAIWRSYWSSVFYNLLFAIWILSGRSSCDGTVTRTYFDKQERRRLGWPCGRWFRCLFIGPVAVMVGQGRPVLPRLRFAGSTISITTAHGIRHAVESQNKERGCRRDETDRWYVRGFGRDSVGALSSRSTSGSGTGQRVLTISPSPRSRVHGDLRSFQIRKWRVEGR